ncbi:MAG: hypothetical protein ABIP54_02725 [Candidatus Andersenbacteria bacterium]
MITQTAPIRRFVNQERFVPQSVLKESVRPDLRPSKDEQPDGDHVHHEYFRKGEGNTWEWWEKMEIETGVNGKEEDFVTQRLKTFTEATFVDEVLQPMVDHVGVCDCAHVAFTPLYSSEGELPAWLAFTPERALPPLGEINLTNDYLRETMFGAGCYGKDQYYGCVQWRISNRAGKIMMLARYGEEVNRLLEESVK